MAKVITLLTILLALSGCATTATLDAAKGVKPFTSEKAEPQPAYYALLPLTVPFDMATFPIHRIVLVVGLRGLH